MTTTQNIFIGTDSGATTSKVGGVWADGTTISTKLLQRPTQSQNGPDAVVHSWVAVSYTHLDVYKRQSFTNPLFVEIFQKIELRHWHCGSYRVLKNLDTNRCGNFNN